MLSSIALILLQFAGVIQPAVSMSFWKWYLPVCAVEIVVYFKCLTKWGEK